MLIAASTVKDTLPHMRRFVSGNLAGGLDHLVVFLDQPGAPGQDDVAAFLDDHPQVTCVRAGPRWWGDRRPAGLNERQCTNATVVCHLLAAAPGVDPGLDPAADPGADHRTDWVFHVDGDEIVGIDRAALAEVPAETPAVRLSVREAVSKVSWDGEPTLFKAPLDDPDLRLLHLLGVISEPTNRAYFHGHLQGKTGVRPSTSVFLGLHRALTASGAPAPTHQDDRLTVFHYESYSTDEFVRKWSEMTTSGPRASFRAGRAAVADAVRTVLEKGLDADVTRAQLARIHERTTLDDADTLLALGLVRETDPLAGTHEPGPLPEPVATALRDGLEALRGADKSSYFVGAAPRGDATPATEQRRRGRLLGRAGPA